PSQGVPRRDRLRQSDIDVLEEIWGCFSVSVEFSKHECMKGIVYGGRDFGGDDPVTLRIDQQHSRSGVELRQNLGDSHLLRTSRSSVLGGDGRGVARPRL